jgi:putative SOS response-associated peptidase YedK
VRLTRRRLAYSNVAPTDQIPIVRIDPRDGERESPWPDGVSFHFGRRRSRRSPNINARAETVHKLPLFREALAKRRCLYQQQATTNGKSGVTVSSRVRRKDLEPCAFAGIWEFARLNGEEILSAAMIVGEPNPLVGGVHDRMPVMLLPKE